MEIKATSAVVTRGASGLGGATLHIATAGGNVVILERDAIGDGLDPGRVDAMPFDQAGSRMSGKLQGPQVPEGLAHLDEGDSSAGNNRDASSAHIVLPSESVHWLELAQHGGNQLRDRSVNVRLTRHPST